METSELEVLGLAHEMLRRLDDIRDALINRGGIVSDISGLTWPTAGVAADRDLKAAYDGVWLYNQESFEVYVGFAPGTGTVTRKAFTLGAGAALTLPFRISFISVGAAALPTAGGLVVAPLAGAGTLR